MEERASTARRRANGGQAFAVRLPLADVPNGSYALRVTARSISDDKRTVSREIPITLR